MDVSFYVYGLYAIGRPKPLFYIGKGCKKRLYKHTKDESKATHKRNVLQKYSCYCMFIIGGLSEKFAYKLEEKLIALYKPQLTNKRNGGLGGTKGLKTKPETIEKIRVSSTGRKHSEKTKAKLADLARKQIRNTPNKEQLKRWFNDYAKSNLTIKQFCIANTLPYYSFKTWRANNKNLWVKDQKYSLDFKRIAIKIFNNANISQSSFAKQLDIPLTTLNQWLTTNK